MAEASSEGHVPVDGPGDAVDYGEYADGETGEGGDAAQAEDVTPLDPEMADIMASMEEMEQDTKALAATAASASMDAAAAVAAKRDLEEKTRERDERSVFVSNVDFSASAEEVGKHFETCGPVERVTILVDKATGHPKGYAYVEFVRKDSVSNALVLNGTEFKGRAVKVIAKRTNVPAWQLRGRGRGRGGPPFRGRGGGGFHRGGYVPGGRGRGYRGAPWRGRGRGWGY